MNYPDYVTKFSSSGLKFSKTLFEIMVDPKVPLSGPTFWLGYEAKDQ